MSRYALLACLFLLAACSRHKVIPENNLVYLQIGDSITYGYKNTPNNSPGDYAARAIDSPATTFIKLGWPGESIREFRQLHRKQLLDSLNFLPSGHRTMLGIAYGPNDLNQRPREQVLADILREVRWARDTAHVPEVLVIPVMSRADKQWGFTRESDGSESRHFNEYRRWLNGRLRAEIASIKGVHMANESDSPAMFADNMPADTKRCADEVHPLDLGAEELGKGTIAHGIASFGNIKLK